LGVSEKLEVQLKLSLRYIIQKKDKTGNEYINKAMISDDQGMPFYGLYRDEKNRIKEMPIEDMEPYCALATYLYLTVSKRSKEDIKEVNSINHITIGLSSRSDKNNEMTLTKEGPYIFISIYNSKK